MRCKLIIPLLWHAYLLNKVNFFCSGIEYIWQEPNDCHIIKTLLPPTNVIGGCSGATRTGFLYVRDEENSHVTGTSKGLTTDQDKIFFFGGGDGDDDDDDNNNNDKSFSKTSGWVLGGIFIGIFGGGLLLCVAGLFIGNVKRIGSGRQPVYGTSWLTPPSYWQSQHDYNNNRGEEPTEFVPTYFEHPNEDIDLGFYDERGEFHLSGQDNEYTTPKSDNEGEDIEQVGTNEETLINSEIPDEDSSQNINVVIPPPAVTRGHSQEHATVIKTNYPPTDLDVTENHS